MYLYLLIFLLIMSFITYCFYANDKRKAKNGAWRTKEATLLLLSFLGGALGGLFAMYGLRHKNRKWYFNVVNFGSLIIHIVIVFFLLRAGN